MIFGESHMAKPEFDKLLIKYIDSATIHGKATMAGDHKAANKQTIVLKKIYKMLEKDKILG
jgi:hypothetical protein